MKKLSLSSLLSKNNNSRSERKSRAAHPQTRALRVESLEARELLSVAPITGLATFDAALVARETYVAAPVPDRRARLEPDARRQRRRPRRDQYPDAPCDPGSFRRGRYWDDGDRFMESRRKRRAIQPLV